MTKGGHLMIETGDGMLFKWFGIHNRAEILLILIMIFIEYVNLQKVSHLPFVFCESLMKIKIFEDIAM